MFLPFDINFREFPYIDIKIWEGCPAACTNCQFNIKHIFEPKQFSIDNIKNRIAIADVMFDKKFWLVFWNQDALNHKDILEILRFWLSTGREVRFQIDFDIKNRHLELLQTIEHELGTENIFIKIAKNARWVDNLKEKTFILMKLLTKNTHFKFYLDVFLDFTEHKDFIDFFHKKFSRVQFENIYSYNIEKTIEMKLHNYSWFVDPAQQKIINLPRKKCQQIEQIMCRDGNIFLKDSLDIYDNGDLFLHDNLCNIWDIRISNIHFQKEKIYNDFVDYLDHLKELVCNARDQSEMCYKCIVNGFKYKK